MSQISTGVTAVKVVYTPSSPASWSPVPANVDSALNQLISIAGSASSFVLSGLTLWASPVVGEVGYISGNDTLSKARANVASTSGVIGVYQGTASSVTIGGKVTLLFGAGLTLAAGNKVFVSENVAGQVTNIDPLISPISGHVSFKIARILNTSGYNIGTGGAVACIWQPESFITIQ